MSLDETKDPNKLFLWRLGGEKPFRILLQKTVTGMQAGSTEPGEPKGQPNRNVIRTRRPDDELIRKKKGGYINFYDLGLLVEGMETRATGIPADEFPDDPDRMDDMRDFYNWPLGISSEDWATTFYKITPAQPAYVFDFAMYDDETVINTGDERIKPSNPKWTPKGFKFKEPFNGIVISDIAYLFENVMGTSDPSHKRVTETPVSTDEEVYLPYIDPKNGNVDIYISALSLEARAYEEVPPPVGGGSPSSSETSLPNGYNISEACPGLSSGPTEPEWEVALITTDAFSNSGENGQANTVYHTPIDRDEVFENPFDPDTMTENDDRMNYLALVAELEYFLNTWSYSGSVFAYSPKAFEFEGIPYVNRNWLCYGGEVYPGNTGTEVQYATNDSDVAPTSPFTFTDSFAVLIEATGPTYPSNPLIGDNGMLLAAVNQGDNWWYIWHTNRYSET